MDTTISAWDGILNFNLPSRAARPGGHMYTFPLRRHAGAWGDGWGRSIVVQRLTPDWDRRTPGARPVLAESTDVAWVELAAPDKARSRGGWRDLMRVAVKRLAEDNSERRLLLILVAGLRWMPFVWDPVAPLHPELGPVVMKGDGEGEMWPVDSHVYMVPREGGDEGTVGLVFDPLEAFTLDFWTQDDSGAVVNLKNLAWLEKLLAAATSETLAGTEKSQTVTAKE
jgi:hypothetical protein